MLFMLSHLFFVVLFHLFFILCHLFYFLKISSWFVIIFAHLSTVFAMVHLASQVIVSKSDGEDLELQVHEDVGFLRNPG